MGDRTVARVRGTMGELSNVSTAEKINFYHYERGKNLVPKNKY